MVLSSEIVELEVIELYNEAYKRKKPEEEDNGWGGFGFSINGNTSTGVVVKKIHYGGTAYKVIAILNIFPANRKRTIEKSQFFFKFKLRVIIILHL